MSAEGRSIEATETMIAGLPRGEITRRGEALLDTLPPELVEQRLGETIVIDVRTNDCSIDRDPIKALDDLKSRQADPACYFAKLGYAAVAHIGTAARRRLEIVPG